MARLTSPQRVDTYPLYTIISQSNHNALPPISTTIILTNYVTQHAPPILLALSSTLPVFAYPATIAAYRAGIQLRVSVSPVTLLQCIEM
jgi:hypothetical protein